MYDGVYWVNSNGYRDESGTRNRAINSEHGDCRICMRSARFRKAERIKRRRETTELSIRFQALSSARQSLLSINCKSPVRNIEVSHLTRKSLFIGKVAWLDRNGRLRSRHDTSTSTRWGFSRLVTTHHARAFLKITPRIQEYILQSYP